MKIKRYIARNMEEARALIRADIGPNAIIISNRKIREPGIVGFFRPPKFEVTAAVDEQQQQIQYQREYNQLKELLSRSITDFNVKEEKAEWLSADHHLAKVMNSLQAADIAPDLAEIVLKKLTQEKSALSQEELKEQLARAITSLFKPVPQINTKPRIMAFVGPPGVGKTTTLAKIGAIQSLFNACDIALITIDTYRIGAVEQIKIYGEIIGAPVEVVITPQELKLAVERNLDKEMIFIDTAGRPSKSTYQIAEIKTFLDNVDSLEIYLVLNATAKEKDLVRMLNDYKILGYSRLIFTKIDETETMGFLLRAAHLTQLPIAYITNGQDVPDDIETASPELLSSLIMKDVVL
ncbi:MAG: hypothetical protein ACOX0E_04860 [Syntrophomonadaceae bacterium]|jgi:flagellar biosynthesis protein FlhF